MTILAAVDGDAKPDRVVTVGEDLAEAYDEQLLVVHVLPEEEFEKRNQSKRREQYTIEDAQRDAQATAKRVVEATTDRFGRIETHGLVGEVVTELNNEVDRTDARYLVIGGRKRTPVGKALFGSVTQSVLLEADVPVVAVMDEPE
jgi:nucleotide-binding universal stress UspA family protein